MKKNKLYFLLLTACFLGYCWLFFSINYNENLHFSSCFMKNITDIPCPSCGTTRAITQLINGHLKDSLLLNPFGIVVAILMILIPFWIVFDFLFKRDSFYLFYKKTEHFIAKKSIAILLIALVLLNWYWNIKKKL